MKIIRSAIDPYLMPETDIAANVMSRLPFGRTLVAQQGVVSGENTAVWLSAGQSTTSNNDDTKYTATSSKAHNLNPYDGGVYPSADPLLGCQGLGGNWLGRCVDKLITAGIFDRVIIVPLGVGGTLVSDWQTSGALFARYAATKRRLDAAGLTVTFMTWMQGEQDAGISTTQSAYQASFGDMVTGIRNLGISAPIFVSQTAYPSTTSSTAVRAAQAAVVNNGAGIYAGPDTDTLTGSNRQASGTSPHWTATGSDACAGLWKTAIDVVF